jgi:tRNA threonylcarbamoyladenosine biosynthesis protein TsaE
MTFPKILFTESPEETERIGNDLAHVISDSNSLPRFIAMYGDLGVGKTAFVRGFSSSLCPSSTVKSPTFALVNEYKCPSAVGGIKRVYHFDMYRIKDEDDLYSIGYYDYLRPDAVCFAEWCEMIPYALPDSYIKVEIEKLDLGSKRKIVISYIGA